MIAYLVVTGSGLAADRLGERRPASKGAHAIGSHPVPMRFLGNFRGKFGRCTGGLAALFLHRGFAWLTWLSVLRRHCAGGQRRLRGVLGLRLRM